MLILLFARARFSRVLKCTEIKQNKKIIGLRFELQETPEPTEFRGLGWEIQVNPFESCLPALVSFERRSLVHFLGYSLPDPRFKPATKRNSDITHEKASTGTRKARVIFISILFLIWTKILHVSTSKIFLKLLENFYCTIKRAQMSRNWKLRLAGLSKINASS